MIAEMINFMIQKSFLSLVTKTYVAKSSIKRVNNLPKTNIINLFSGEILFPFSFAEVPNTKK